ncbi:twin-arginine translocase TatA/TatE family subunit [Candidatus Pollutiaquabacter sp.]|uniref:twin-arginine translocase TatA/TatE family subunit n=1 Tax=Candidatus Pollutiaquabacter sp. TaxID=3416354 RepID=UPI003C9B78A2|nr:twin-arginine translocase TatA/TatE family subunit [Bacteroidota bacterium]
MLIWGLPQGPELLLILAGILLLFGGKKLPELMKGLGRGISEFKKAKDGDDDQPDSKAH